MTIREQGSFSDLMSSGGLFAELMETQGATGAEDSDSSTLQDMLTSRPDVQTDADVLVALKGAGKAGGLMEDEDRKKGKISKEVRW